MHIDCSQHDKLHNKSFFSAITVNSRALFAIVTVLCQCPWCARLISRAIPCSHKNKTVLSLFTAGYFSREIETCCFRYPLFLSFSPSLSASFSFIIIISECHVWTTIAGESILWAGLDEDQGQEEVVDPFIPQERVFSKYAAMLYTSNNSGKTFEEFKDAKFCASCGEKARSVFWGFFFGGGGGERVCVPQLYLWGSPLLGEIFAYVTVF